LIELAIAENVRFLFMIALYPLFKNGDRMVFGEVVDCDRTNDSFPLRCNQLDIWEVGSVAINVSR
jgi:hypothetical protein